MIKVSIIIPVYNVAPYIEKCICSVMEQTYPNIECILVDDCGQDQSMQIVLNLIKQYEGCIQFIVLHHEKNRGLSAARNTGIHKSTGEYLYFLDSDDFLPPNSLEILTSYYYEYGSVDIIEGHYANVPAKENPQPPLHDGIYKSHVICKPLYLRNYISSWNKLINKSFLLNNHLFFKEGVINEDVLWHFYISVKINSFCYCHQTTYYYLTRENSITTESNYKYKTDKAMGIIYKEIINFLLINKEEITTDDIVFWTEQFIFTAMWMNKLPYSFSEISKGMKQLFHSNKKHMTTKYKFYFITFFLPFFIANTYARWLKKYWIFKINIELKLNILKNLYDMHQLQY